MYIYFQLLWTFQKAGEKGQLMSAADVMIEIPVVILSLKSSTLSLSG